MHWGLPSEVKEYVQETERAGGKNNSISKGSLAMYLVSIRNGAEKSVQ